MKTVVATTAVSVALSVLAGCADSGWVQHDPGRASSLVLAGTPLLASAPGAAASPAALGRLARVSFHPVSARPAAPSIPDETLSEVLQRTCAGCHSEQRRSGNLSLADFDVTRAHEKPEITEKMIVKLRADMMPPPGVKRPGADTLVALVETLERNVDQVAAKQPNAGGRTFQRLNRAEYARSIQNLLGLQIDAGKWLPLDTKSANFDNIADVQLPSAMLLDSYLDAAAEISRLAVGDPHASTGTSTYNIPRLGSQWERAEGAPVGTRGGTSVVHNFPADGEYVFNIALHAIPTGELYGLAAPFDQRIEVSVNGERVALLEVDRWMGQRDPNGLNLKTNPIPVRAGPQRITAAFVRTFEGPVNDLLAPYDHSIADTQIGAEYGITNESHMRELSITGPFHPTGVSETPTRQKIFSCRPTMAAEERPCAEEIVSRLAPEAYRRPISPEELGDLMDFYAQGAEAGGFEEGIRMALEAMLSSPHFILRFEELPANAKPGQTYPIAGIDLASRLSFFLWGTPPDEELLALAERGKLADRKVLEQQARRMLADPRSEALATRFAAQWLRLSDLDLVHPDALQFPNFYEQLAESMKRETELFFYDLVREDRSLLDFYTADYTFVNERLARHYGIPGVTGEHFRKVAYPTDQRRGILGHGSVLTLTSVANRTSPVLRGKWVMEVLMGTPPPPPPPNVPALEDTEGASEGRMLTTRERMEMHRASPACRSCHNFMDPIGLALDNYDVTGQWRIRENGMPLDTRGDFYDGTPVTSPRELNEVLLKRPIPLVRTFTENLMAYALGRRVEYYDQPTVRSIARAAAEDEYRMSDFILGVVQSDAFRMKTAAGSSEATESSSQQGQ